MPSLCPLPSEPVLELLSSRAVVHPRAQGPRLAVLADPPDPFAARRARALVIDACAQWRLARATDDAVLVASELVTNAVVHARTWYELHLWQEGSLLHVAVHDRESAF